MPRAVFALVVLPLVSVAAPVPKSKPALGEFGELAVPKVKCELSEGGVLTMNVPSDEPGPKPNGKSAVAPTVMKAVEGDFVLAVHVTQTLPSETVPRPINAPGAGVAAGVALVGKDDRKTRLCAVVHWDASPSGWRASNRFAFHQSAGRSGGLGSVPAAYQPTQEVIFRVTRRGSEVGVEASGDGKKWQEVCSSSLKGLSESVMVGPFASQTGGVEFTTTFDHYEIKPLEKDAQQ